MPSRNTKKDPYIGKLLCELMDSKGLTVRQAAQVAGVGVSTVQSWRTGARPEDLRAFRKLARELGVSLELLLTGEEDPPNNAIGENQALGFLSSGVLFDGLLKVKIERIIPYKGAGDLKTKK